MRAALVDYGKMNRAVHEALCEIENACVVGIVDVGYLESLNDIGSEIDVVIDFSHPSNLNKTLDFAKSRGVCTVIGTTGLTDEQKAAIAEAAKSAPIMYSANFSVGIAVLKRAVAMVAQALGDAFDIEIVEKHHNKKADAPSGTALALADCADPEGALERVFGRSGQTGARGREMGIHSVRGGTAAGEHSVLFMGQDELVELRHESASRRIFAVGAARAAVFMLGKPVGLYSLENALWGD